jgi:hypothetical protein
MNEATKTDVWSKAAMQQHHDKGCGISQLKTRAQGPFFFQELKSTRSFLRATSAGDPRTSPGSLSISQSTDSISVRDLIFLIRVHRPTASS